MSTVTAFAFGSGLAMGMSASLHCAVMCGGIAGSIGLLHRDAPLRRRASALAQAQVGRILGYTIAGTIAGLAGTRAIGLLDRQAAYHVLQWGAAVTLAWIGLSIAGVLPSLAVGERLVGAITRHLLRLAGDTRGTFALGLIWGFLPCGMVYAALFAAMLTGSARGGAVLMLGFGVGTLPAIISVGLGATAFARLTRQIGRRAVGLGIAGLGAVSLTLTAPGGPLCLIP